MIREAKHFDNMLDEALAGGGAGHERAKCAAHSTDP